MKRGHSVDDSVQAAARLREAGLKVGFHMMPGLPGSTPEIDLQVFRELFSDSRFRPDYLKIYPTLVVEGTELYRMYLRGDYAPSWTGRRRSLSPASRRSCQDMCGCRGCRGTSQPSSSWPASRSPISASSPGSAGGAGRAVPLHPLQGGGAAACD